MSTTTPYSFGSTDVDLETQRLDELEALWDPGTFSRLERLGIARGARCLDVGAGRGSVPTFLLARCGTQGKVVATDIDVRWISTIQHPNFEWRRHDIVLDSVDDFGLFDVIHVRLLLSHLGARASAVLGRLADLLAPGGTILIEEPLRLSTGDPEHPSVDTMRATVNRFFDEADRVLGFDFMMGAKVGRMMTDAGLVDIESEIATPLPRGGDLLRRWYDTSIRSMASKMDVSPFLGDVDAFLAANRDSALFFVQWALVSSSGRKVE